MSTVSMPVKKDADLSKEVESAFEEMCSQLKGVRYEVHMLPKDVSRTSIIVHGRLSSCNFPKKISEKSQTERDTPGTYVRAELYEHREREDKFLAALFEGDGSARLVTNYLKGVNTLYGWKRIERSKR